MKVLVTNLKLGALLCDLVECEVPFSLSMLHLPFGRAGAPGPVSL